MTWKSDLKRDYKITLEAWKEAKKRGDKETMQRHSHDLVKIADALEGCD